MAPQPTFATQMPTTSDGKGSSASSAKLQNIKDTVLTNLKSGNWDAVLKMYEDNEQNIQTVNINNIKGSILHIAIFDSRNDMAFELLDILKDPKKIMHMIDSRRNNPLHLAASLGHAKVCKVLVEKDPELIWSRNIYGETALFLAALHGREEAFFTLHDWAKAAGHDISHCRRNIDGSSILHVTILGEKFELAFKILKLYPELSTFKNERGHSPFHILASNPSAFRSGCHLGPLEDFVYHDGPEEKLPSSPNYYMEFVMELLLFFCGLGFNVTEILRIKQKHAQSLQLMKELVLREKLSEHEGIGSKSTVYIPSYFTNEGMEMMNLPCSSLSKPISIDATLETEEDARGMEKSPFLISAMMGVTEIVEEILNVYPEAIDHYDADGKNVLLLAAEYKQPAVYNILLKILNNAFLFETVDKDGNSLLHLAAGPSNSQSWHASGVALQMQCELKWYQFIKSNSRPMGLNFKGMTPKEIFIDAHKDLVKKAQDWLTSTSNSCSVVVTVIATVSYASVTDLRGGAHNLDQPLRNVFAIFSLVSICTSVASLGVFLSILTSDFQMMDFLYNLPSKLILGLTLLFISVSAMLVSFSISHFFVVEDQLAMTTLPIYAIVCVPITLFAGALFPLYFSVIRSTLTQPKRSNETTILN